MSSASVTQAPAKRKESAPTSSRPLGQRVHPHIAHILAHLERLKGGQLTVRDPEEVFLGRAEGHFLWELICFRLSGHPHPILGCVRFRRHDFPGKVHARESLSAYLSQPPDPLVNVSAAVPIGALPVLLPRTAESIPGFLRNLAKGDLPEPAFLDPTMIELAWDFRTYNPYGVESLKYRAGPLRDRLMRTARGHVLRGMSHELILPDATNERFVAVKDPVQLTTKGMITLPPLALNRSFLAISTDITEQKTRLAATNWTPFITAAAEKRHLLLG